MRTRPITPRHREILAAWVRGLTNAEVADELGISPHTVEAHSRKIIERLGAADKADAIKVWLKDGVA